MFNYQKSNLINKTCFYISLVIFLILLNRFTISLFFRTNYLEKENIAVFIWPLNNNFLKTKYTLLLRLFKNNYLKIKNFNNWLTKKFSYWLIFIIKILLICIKYVVRRNIYIFSWIFVMEEPFKIIFNIRNKFHGKKLFKYSKEYAMDIMFYMKKTLFIEIYHHKIFTYIMGSRKSVI